MEELKLLLEVVRGLPTGVLWVLLGFLFYKLMVLGSIYGVIRLFIIKTHDWLMKPKNFSFRGKVMDPRITHEIEHAINDYMVACSGVLSISEGRDLVRAIDDATTKRRGR